VNWAANLWQAIQHIVFWFVLLYGLIASSGTVFGEVPSWQTRLTYGFIFIACLLIFARILHYL
jgi:hypothetical protein